MRLHHVAYVTENVQEKAAELQRLLKLTPAQVGTAVVDEAQGVKCLFLELGGGQLELLEPLGPASPVQRHLRKGGGLFHLCFEVDDLEAALEQVRAADGIVVKDPLPAPAIGNRRVAFVVSDRGDLFEFVEATKQ